MEELVEKFLEDFLREHKGAKHNEYVTKWQSGVPTIEVETAIAGFYHDDYKVDLMELMAFIYSKIN